MIHGSATLVSVFEKYDRDGSGFLDAKEFAAVATEMGFGAVAHQIFKRLDRDGSGSISYRELTASLGNSVPTDADTKRMLSSLVWGWDEANRAQRVAPFDTSGWSIGGTDAASVKQELRELLRRSGAHVTDLLRLFDQDLDTALLIDDMEFYSAMRDKFGFRGNSRILKQVFDELDTDGSGCIGFDELFEFVRGRRHSLDRRNKQVRSMRIEPPSDDCTLDEVVWDVRTLRSVLQRMMVRPSRTLSPTPTLTLA